MERAMQDRLPVHCFGCGALNEHGLQIKSFWSGEEVVCAWRPRPYHIGHPGVLYGGLIASVVDCHCIWTAAAHAARQAGIELDEAQSITFVTGTLTISYRKPIPIEQAIELRARVVDFTERKSVVKCSVSSRGVLCAEAEMIAVRISAHRVNPQPQTVTA
jgi:acyl-CoA thioesterase FadM